MAFHGLMLLRDEQDIIAQNLDHLLGWIDNLYVLDLGSTDQTWDIVQDYARRDSRIVPYMHRSILYNDNLRCVLFDQYRDRFRSGDWVMKIDADEFYHATPPDFIRERTRRGETAVHLLWYYFRLTRAEVDAYESGSLDETVDRQRPIEQRRRFYQIASYTEPRMFRYRRAMAWPESTSFPYNAGYVARERIPIRHYPHRDPSQLAARYRLRAQMMQLNASAGRHWKLADWREDIVDPVQIGVRRETGVAAIAGLETNQVHYWAPGALLPDVRPTNHLASGVRRLAQRLIHPMLLPILDRTRRGFDETYQPTFIDGGITA